MQTEIEVKFCKVDVTHIRDQLELAGASCKMPMRLMRRQVFYPVDKNRDAFVRVRDEGNKVTMTYKHFEEHSLTGAKEAEVVVDDFEAAQAILLGAGLVPKSSQETRRETWVLGDVEIVIDEWPWLEPFIEIEGPSEKAVKEVATQLGYDWDDAIFGGATQAYKASYPDLPADFIMDDEPEIRFDLPLPDRLKNTHKGS